MNLFTKKEWIALGVVAVFAAVGVGLGIVSASSGALEVHFFDVGQGDAIFVETPEGNQVLIDGGPDKTVLAKLENVMPFYDRSLDLVAASHMDGDHIEGLIPVLKNFQVGGVVVSTRDADTPVSKEFWNIVQRKEIPVFMAASGDRITASDDIRFQVLAPWPALADSASDNDVSLVMKLEYKNDSFLLTGDIERRVELALATAGVNLDSDVLKVAHHGSNSSSNNFFLDEVDPKISIIQVGDNSYGHPHKVVLERLSSVEILRNDRNGDITIYSYGNSI